MSDPTSFSVPKFSSFKTRPPAQETEEKPRQEKEARRGESRERRRDHRHRPRSRSLGRRRDRRRDVTKSPSGHESGRSREEGPRSERHVNSHRRHRSRSRSPSRIEVPRHRSRSRTPTSKKSESRKSASKSPPIPSIASGSKYFIIDRRGDPQNITYGRIHRYDIPRFRRIGWGSIMGLNRRFKIENRHSEEADGMIIVDHRQLVGKKEKYAFARNEKKGTRLLKIKEVHDDESEDILASNGDFVPLSKPKKKERRNSSSSAEADYKRMHFQLFEEKAENQPEDSDLLYATETDSNAEGRVIKIEDATRQKHVALCCQVEKHPEDIEAWFALINHQDAMLGLGGGAQHKATEAELKSTADIKISMYQKALKAAGRKSDPLKNRERIILEMMKEGAKIWTQAEQAERWEQATRQEVASSLLWKRYLDFRMSDFQGFVYEDLKQLFLDRMALLTNVKNNIQLDDPSLRLERIHQQMVYVLIRATLFMRENGRTELSVAIWQAVLEYNCYHRQEGGMREFEDFWEREVARIGEKGARGFCSLDDEDPTEARKDKDLPSECQTKQDFLAGWASAERFRAGSSRWPAKTCDNTVEDDPYRVILWSDIEDFVVDLGVVKTGQWTLSNDAHMMLVDGFLMFCRLPPLMRAGWFYDQFSLDNLIDVSSEHIRKEYLVHTSESEEILAPFDASRPPQKGESDDKAHGYIYASSLHNFIMSTDTLFPSKSWAQSLPKWTDLYTDDPFAGPLDFRFVQRCLDSLVRSYPTDALAEYYLAWMFINQPFNMRKLTSDVISKRPHSRRLYNAHALILWNQGKKERAVGVWTKVLGMPESPNRTEKKNDISLWRSRILCHLADGDKDMALKCLLTNGGNAATVDEVDTKSSVLHLRAKQQLSSARDFLLSTGSEVLAAVAAQNAECLSLLYYLAPSAESTEGRDIEGALGVIDHFVAALKSYNHNRPKEHESILQSSARLLWYHIRSGPFRPALIRERMAEALKLFPQNTIFMSLYAWNESRTRIDERVRAMLRDTVLLPEHDCITSRLFAIRHEMLRGNKHSIRAAFEHALESERGKGSAGLWRLYILWCAQSSDDKVKEQAKEVLHRGMRACPGVKPIMMEAFETLRPLMDDEECRNVYTVMEEIQVRLHVNLEDWVEKQSHGESDNTEIRV